MILIVGLGNPGRKYSQTRHNLGFAFVDYIKRVNGFSDWKMNTRFKAKISKGELFGKTIIFAKPQTFMNQSGQAVSRLIKFYKIPLKNLWVIHDDVDLPLGKIKIVKNRGSAFHKGVQSIIDELGSKDFTRFRIGIAPLENNKKMNRKRFVLEKFRKEERTIINKIKKKLYSAAEIALEKDIQKAINEFNQNK